jgi:uncharacterized membrane protein YdjX (TVP38/TMEM64 family)
VDAREVEKRKKKKILTAAVLVLLTAAVLVFCAVYADSIKRVASDPAFVRGWFRAHEPYGTLVYCFVTVVQILLAFLPGEPLELAAGYAFGAVKGSLLCLLAEGAGSVLVLLLVRRFGPGIVRLFFSEEQLERLRFLHYSPKRLLLFAIIFMMPGTPKDLLCYFAGLTDIDINKLIIICTVGRIPSILTSTLGGNAIGEQRYVFAVAVFAVTALLSVAGIAFYNYICSKHEQK